MDEDDEWFIGLALDADRWARQDDMICVSRMLVGSGAAKQWLTGLAERMAGGRAYGMNDLAPIEVANGLMFGMRITVDPDMPPDQIRIGTTVFMFGPTTGRDPDRDRPIG